MNTNNNERAMKIWNDMDVTRQRYAKMGMELTSPEDIIDGLFDEMLEAQTRDGFWNVENYTQARAMYKGRKINDVNMKRVIGIA